MDRPKHLIAPNEGARLLAATNDDAARERICRQQIDRWREVVLDRPTERAKDAHRWWLEMAAHEDIEGLANDIALTLFTDPHMLTARQARRLVG